jgi:hypothetical protein
MLKYTQEEFITKAALKHNNKYDYSLVNYVNGATITVIICPYHGNFSQTPYKHLSGRGCPLCTHNNISNNAIVFIADATKLHQNKYNYSMVDYTNARTKVVIICPHHGHFQQTPDSHIHGHGCPKCMAQVCSTNKRSSTSAFIKAANIIHSNFYNYSKVAYETAHIKVVIICPKHGPFKQTPDTHLRGCGCSSCVNVISRIETLWLDGLGIPNDIGHRQVSININGTLFRADGFDPKTNTVYELYGDFWHGHPTKYNPNDINVVNKQTFGQLYYQTMEKENILKTAGYNIVSIWESDYREQIKHSHSKI